MTTTTVHPSADAYLAAVRTELDDLSDEDRGELLEDLASHLADLEAEGDDTAPLIARLGPPAQYAADLRAAAGLPPRSAASAQPTARTQTRATIDRVVDAWCHPGAVRARVFLRELRPAWWLLRAYLAVLILAAVSGGGYHDVPLPRIGGTPLLGLVFIAAAMVVSVRLGRRAAAGGAGAERGIIVAANILIGLAALVLALNFQAGLGRTQFVTVDGGPSYPLESLHGPVTNIYPYSADGTPLSNVLLFDQDGRPLRTAHQEWWADGCRRVVDHPEAADGVPVEFSYPHAYVAGPGERCAPASAPPGIPLPAFPEAETTSDAEPTSDATPASGAEAEPTAPAG